MNFFFENILFKALIFFIEYKVKWVFVEKTIFFSLINVFKNIFLLNTQWNEHLLKKTMSFFSKKCLKPFFFSDKVHFTGNCSENEKQLIAFFQLQVFFSENAHFTVYFINKCFQKNKIIEYTVKWTFVEKIESFFSKKWLTQWNENFM